MSYRAHFTSLQAKEEKANMLTHLLGVVLFFAGTIALLIKAHSHFDVPAIISAWVFGISLVVLYSASALYHAMTTPAYKKIFKLIDHCAIFLLIAGTYTPFLLVSLRNEIHFSFLATMWAIAVFGILYKVFMIKKYRLLSTLIYLAMGWMALFKIHVFYRVLSTDALLWMLAGGLFYSAGTFFYTKDDKPYYHAVWHLFVLCGSASHFVAIYWYVFET